MSFSDRIKRTGNGAEKISGNHNPENDWDIQAVTGLRLGSAVARCRESELPGLIELVQGYATHINSPYDPQEAHHAVVPVKVDADDPSA